MNAYLKKEIFFLCAIFLFALNAVCAEKEVPVYPENVDLEREEIEQYRQRYLTPYHNRNLFTILENGEQYRYYVRRRLLEEKMPLFIEFIPVIESSYKPLASPKDGRSIGLWQFMENSIENYLRKTKWIDERRDPWKSTDAALQKLKANYKTFGDWLLAIAAYNCGAGAVSRALKKSAEKNYWALCEQSLIPEHAINYIPNLLAVSDIATNSELYQTDMPKLAFDTETYSPLDDFDYIEVKQSVSIKALAMEMRMDSSILERLNSALVYGVTPPDEEYEIRLPSGMKEAAKDALFSIMMKSKIADK